ncbi:MAG: type II toxin-antitoxin system HicA family toxin [Chthoniobacterales bacterium]
MKIPRNVSGSYLVNQLRFLGYAIVRQDGSHIRLTTQLQGQHHVTIPHHSPIKLGTLSSILKAVAAHHDLSVDELVHRLSL